MATHYRALSKSITAVLLWMIRCYRYCISPLLGSCCRYYPTCSQYALEAFAQHGCCQGLWLTVKRILSCHPFAAGGFDPVPHQLEMIKHHDNHTS
jgi:putative membrane protein insertion efficiency factor